MTTEHLKDILIRAPEFTLGLVNKDIRNVGTLRHMIVVAFVHLFIALVSLSCICVVEVIPQVLELLTEPPNGNTFQNGNIFQNGYI